MANEYASALDLMARLGIPRGDSREGAVMNVLTAASRWVEQQTGHRFYTATETRYYSPIRRHVSWSDNGWSGGAWDWAASERPFGIPTRIEVDDFLSVTSVATDEDGDGTYERVWTAVSDYWLGPRNAPAKGQPYRYLNRNAATGRYLFPLWEDSIAITGVCGFCALTDVPADVQELTLMVGEVMGTSLTDLSQPGVQTYNINGQLSVVMSPESLPTAGKDILAFYRGMSIL